MDGMLRNKIANLESNISADVQVGSIMQHKSKVVKIYHDTRLDANLLNVLVKAREVEHGSGRDSVITQFTGVHALKVLVLPRKESQNESNSRLTIAPLGIQQQSS